MTEVLDIAGLIEDLTAPRWEPWPRPEKDRKKKRTYPDLPGFEVLLELPDAPASFAALGQSGENNDEAQRLRAYNRQIISQAVKDWRGLTIGGLKKLLNKGEVKFDGPDDTPAPFSPKLKDLVVKLSDPFFTWAALILISRRREEADDEKNSGATPNTSPTPSPAPAKAAGKRRSGSA